MKRNIPNKHMGAALRAGALFLLDDEVPLRVMKSRRKGLMCLLIDPATGKTFKEVPENASGDLIGAVLTLTWEGVSLQLHHYRKDDLQVNFEHHGAPTRSRLLSQGRGRPDVLGDLLRKVLLNRVKPAGFPEIFDDVMEGLQTAGNTTVGEIQRLRTYEKLQALLTQGKVCKIGKEYAATNRLREEQTTQ